MKDGEKFFVILISLCVAFGIIGAGAMFAQELLTRAALPDELRTQEMIQKLYNGAVCLSCEMTAYVFLFFSVISSGFLLLCFGAYRLSSGHSSA